MLFNKIIDIRKMRGEWRISTLVPVCKNKKGIKSCPNDRGSSL